MEDLQLVLQLRTQIKNSLSALSITVTSGGVDSFEIYKYMLGQINAYEVILQEISNLLENKEQRDTKGTIIDIKPRVPKA